MEFDAVLAHDHMSDLTSIRKMKCGNVKIKVLNLLMDAMGWADTRKGFVGSYYEYNGYFARTAAAVEDFIGKIEACDDIIIIKNSDDVKRCLDLGQTGIVLGFEGGKGIERDIFLLRALYRMGVRHIQFTWCLQNHIGSSQYDTQRGISGFGMQVIEEMNRLGMLIDVTHFSKTGIRQVLRLSKRPILCGHCAAAALSNDPQNLDDDLLKQFRETGSVIGVHFMAHILKNKEKVAIQDFCDVVRYIKKVAGIEIIGLGPDFEIWNENYIRNTSFFYENEQYAALLKRKCPISYLEGYEEVSSIKNVAEALAKNNFSTVEVEKIMGGNMLRLITNCFEV